jgi:hypothetical protein
MKCAIEPAVTIKQDVNEKMTDRWPEYYLWAGILYVNGKGGFNFAGQGIGASGYSDASISDFSILLIA